MEGGRELFVGKIMRIFHPLLQALLLARARWHQGKTRCYYSRSKSLATVGGVGASETAKGEIESIVKKTKFFLVVRLAIGLLAFRQ